MNHKNQEQKFLVIISGCFFNAFYDFGEVLWTLKNAFDEDFLDGGMRKPAQQ